MPSRLTLVPGSQGPRHSGSVDRATSDVLTATERVRTISCSQGEAMSLFPIEARRWSGGGAGVETGDSIWKKARERQNREIKSWWISNDTWKISAHALKVDSILWSLLQRGPDLHPAGRLSSLRARDALSYLRLTPGEQDPHNMLTVWTQACLFN